MTIKGSLQVNISIVKDVLSRNFLSSVENWPKISVLESKYKILFSRPPKGTSLREKTSFDLMSVKSL